MVEKRLYWLKLKDNFFERLDIKAMRMFEDGSDMVIIYIKMLLSALNSEGKIVYQNIMSDCEEEIALTINEDTEKVRKTLEFLIKIGAAAKDDNGCILLTELAGSVGSECESAERVRKLRKNNALQCNENVTPDIDIEKEKDIEKDTENTSSNRPEPQSEKSVCEKTDDFRKITEEFNNICKSLPKVTAISQTRKKKIQNADIRLGGEFTEFFRKIESSDFLTGKKGKWKASFDWVLKPENLIKILEGNYDNNTGIRKNSVNTGEYPPTYSIDEFENQSVLDYYN